jgi:serine/threonine-protein kinase
MDDIAVSGSDLYIADVCQMHVVDALGIISTFAGAGPCGGSFNGDNIDATTAHINPTAIAVDDSGGVYIADSVSCRIRLVSAGIISTVAGTGTCGVPADGSTATAANIDPTTLTVRGSELWFGENCGVWSISGGTISSVRPAVSNCLARDFDIDAPPQPSTALLVASADRNSQPRICSLDSWDTSALVLTHLAGSSPCGSAGDGGLATDGSFETPLGVAVAADGDAYIVTVGNCTLRRVHSGVLSTVDIGTECPVAIAAAGDGSVLFVDYGGGCTAGLSAPWFHGRSRTPTPASLCRKA